MRNTGKLVAPFVIVLSATSITGNIVALVSGDPVANSDPEGVICEAGMNMCMVTWHGDVIALGFNISMLLYGVITLTLLPRSLWSPVTAEAILQTREWRLGRLRHLHVALIPPVILTFAIVLKYALLDPTVYPVSQHVVFFANCAGAIYQAIFLIWLHVPLGAPSPRHGMSHYQRDELMRSKGVCRFAVCSWLRSLVVLRESSARFQKIAMLIIIGTLFTQKETFDMYLHIPAMMAIMWALRFAAIAIFLLARDEDADFEVLEETGEAFGLVVDANDLFKAVSHVMRYNQPSPSPVRTYKATLERMADTMSVSYRWQDEREDIAAGRSINMSTWQMQSLVDALSQSTCRYVWIDKMSVVQRPCGLQDTLLSRMMAVYASSGCTLVLRSCEPEGSRYHQRGWTVQEFCACSKTAILTQPPVAPPQSQGGVRVSRLRIAVYGHVAQPASEERYFMDLRRWHLKRCVSCRPFWLYNDVVGATDALQKFWELSGRVNTRYPEDMVRALIPMLTNCPVETQGELLALMRMMETQAGTSLQEQLDMFATRRKSGTSVRISMGDGVTGSGLSVSIVREQSVSAANQIGDRIRAALPNVG